MAEYTINITDPKSGKHWQKKITGKGDLTDVNIAQLSQMYAQKAGVAPENVQITLGGAQTEKAARFAGEPPRSKTGMAGPFRTLPALGSASLQSLPYVLPAAIPGVGPAGMAARTALSSIIGGVEGAIKKQDVKESALQSGLIQGGLETIFGPGASLVKRLGGRQIRKQADQLVTRLMTGLKKIVPAWKDLPDSHAGLHALIKSGKGLDALSEMFGTAIQSVKDQVPKESMMTLPTKDVEALGITFTPQVPSGRVRVTSPEQLAALTDPKEVSVPIHDVIDKVTGTYKKDRALSQRTYAALDEVLPDIASAELREARRQFREGSSAMNILRDVNALEESTQRLDVERLVVGTGTRKGKENLTPLERHLRPSHAPEASKLFGELVPPGMQAPHAVEPGLFYLFPSTGHFGVRGHPSGETTSHVAKRLAPKTTLYSAGIPLTTREKAFRQVTPSLVHAGAKALEVSP